jgi:hypothetical protein
MTKRWTAVAVALLIAGSAGPAGSAGSAGSAGALPLRFDCDTAEGNSSELRATQAGPSYRIRGQLTARLLRVHPRWQPTASVIVASADHKVVVALQMTAPKRPEGPLDLFLSGPGGDDRPRIELGQAAIGEKLPFELVVAGGKATARIGDRRAEVAAAVGAGAQVSVSCSTGEFLFEDFTLQPTR